MSVDLINNKVFARLIKEMFSDFTPEVVSLKSTWQKTRQMAEVGIQTKPIKCADGEVQEGEYSSQMVQTDAQAHGLDTETAVDPASVDWKKLGAFLTSVEPMIIKTLEKNRQQAFLFSAYHSNIDEFDAQVQLMQTFKHADVPEGLQVNCISWNATGTSVVAAFGNPLHEDWCSHHGWLCTWNVERRVIDPNKAHWSTQMNSCCTCTSFHPFNPSVLAAGNYTGEVVVWSLAEENGEILASGLTNQQQPITSLTWFGADLSNPKLATGGSDGRILVWVIPSRGQQLEIVQCFQITIGDLPRVLRGKVTNTNRETGVTAMSFRKREEERFMVGTETGAVFYCSLQSRNASGDLLVTGSNVPVYDPVVLPLKPHTGPVYGVLVTNFGDRLYGTCSADGSVCIRDILKSSPLIDLDLNSGPVLGLSWSPVRPTVVAFATATGKVALLDLSVSLQKPSVWIEVSTAVGCVVSSVAFNPQRPRLLACGDSLNTVKVYQLGESMASVQGDEEAVLDEIRALSVDQD